MALKRSFTITDIFKVPSNLNINHSYVLKVKKTNFLSTAEKYDYTLCAIVQLHWTLVRYISQKLVDAAVV